MIILRADPVLPWCPEVLGTLASGWRDGLWRPGNATFPKSSWGGVGCQRDAPLSTELLGPGTSPGLSRAALPPRLPAWGGNVLGQPYPLLKVTPISSHLSPTCRPCPKAPCVVRGTNVKTVAEQHQGHDGERGPLARGIWEASLLSGRVRGAAGKAVPGRGRV